MSIRIDVNPRDHAEARAEARKQRETTAEIYRRAVREYLDRCKGAKR